MSATYTTNSGFELHAGRRHYPIALAEVTQLADRLDLGSFDDPGYYYVDCLEYRFRIDFFCHYSRRYEPLDDLAYRRCLVYAAEGAFARTFWPVTVTSWGFEVHADGQCNLKLSAIGFGDYRVIPRGVDERTALAFELDLLGFDPEPARHVYHDWCLENGWQERAASLEPRISRHAAIPRKELL